MNENYIEDWQYYKAGIISRKADCDNVLMTSTEAKRLFKRFGGLYIRWVSNFDTQEPSEFYSVIKDNKTDLEDYSSKVRNMIRRCINNCVVKIIDYHDIITGGGYKIYLSELRRYEKNGYPIQAQSKEKWIVGKVESSARGEEYWGCYYKNKLIAYCIVNPKGREIGLVTWKCDYENYKEFYPSYGMLYIIIKHYLKKADNIYISDGQRTLTGHSNVQDFLESKFGFRKAYLKLNVKFRWYIIPIVAILSPLEKYITNNKLLSIVRLYKWSR